MKVSKTSSYPVTKWETPFVDYAALNGERDWVVMIYNPLGLLYTEGMMIAL